MSVMSLSGRKYGVHKKIVYVHAATLKEAEYKLKLSLKASNTFYWGCKKFSIHGIGQGSGNLLMIWCFISSILFNCHNQKAHGLTAASSNGDIVVSFSIIGFVDDSTCVTGGTKWDNRPTFSPGKTWCTTMAQPTMGFRRKTKTPEMRVSSHLL